MPRYIELWEYYKPPGVLVTHHDPLNRSTIFDLLPEKMKRFLTVGRLDYNSEGLILLTNSGDLANYLCHPQNEVSRTYIVKAFGSIKPERVLQMQGRKKIGGLIYTIKKVIIESQKKNNWIISFTVNEGKNREIRNIMNHLDLRIKMLRRVQYGKFGIGKLTLGGLKKANNNLVEEYLQKMSKS